jgi:signal transduction histidine kinase
MDAVRQFLKNHFVWVGLAAVAVPLSIGLLWQYRLLVAQERALPVYQHNLLQAGLQRVAHEVQDAYLKRAEQLLTVPAAAVANRQRGVIMGVKERGGAAAALTAVSEQFARQDLSGVRRLFIAVVVQREERYLLGLFFFNAQRGALETGEPSAEWRAIHSAVAPYRIYIETGGVANAALTSVERDVEHRLLLKPIVDESGQAVAVTGLLPDEAFFKTRQLPALLAQALPRAFPDLHRDLSVAFHTQDESLPAAEVAVPLERVFTGCRLSMRQSGATPQQLARRSFLLNLSFVGLLALLVVAGLALALRTASRAIRLARMKADFVSNVSHELRTPLASIRVFGEFLRTGRFRDHETVHEFGAYIETESRRLTQLINNVLDFSRIESGRKVYEFAAVNAGEIVAEVCRAFAIRLRQEGFEIALENGATNLPPIEADAEALTQVLVNLLDNAIKYSGEARRIAIRLGQSNGCVTIAVSDRGIGIAAEEQAKIFEKFYRVGNTLVHDVKGSGLGLAIVKHIIEAHRGQVTVTSRLGAGSTFIIHLPVADTPDHAIKPHAARVLNERIV